LGVTSLLAVALGGSTASCIPEGPPTPNRQPVAASSSGPAAGPLKTRPPAAPGGGVVTDDFERTVLGTSWNALSAAWRLEEGELCGRNARNQGIWLREPIPTHARIEFDARSDSPDGDIKVELWGDGRTGAKAASYDDATSYLAILGGWRNTKHVLARLDEHGEDRLELSVDPEASDPRALPVEPGQRYRFRIERPTDDTLSWWVDDRLMFELQDPEPLVGEGHDHFGFNNWVVRVCFDNLKITPL
jgi:hypothetical protein